MIRNTVAALAIAAIASTAMLGSPGTAEAGGKKRFHFKFHAPYYKVWHDHKNYYGPCGWLKKKAKWTGKRYWWKKYHRCMDHYYY